MFRKTNKSKIIRSQTLQEIGVTRKDSCDSGAITIDELNTVTGTVTGTFYFNAYTADGECVMNFSEGVIYKLPVTEVTL